VGEPDSYRDPRLSPDGRKLAVVVDRTIWIYDTATGARTKFFVLGSNWGGSPVWSPGGDRIVFFSYRKGRSTTLFVKPINGANEEVLLESPDESAPEDWSADGRYVSFDTMRVRGKRNEEIWVLRMDGGRKVTPFAAGAAGWQWQSRFSPDGRWIAYASEESGTYEVYVRSFPGPGGKWQVSAAGGGQPRWRRDGKELYYLSADNKVMAVPVRLDPTFQGGSPAALFSVRGGTVYDVSADGQRFLVNSDVTEQVAPPLTLITDWTALLKE
jgi:Tol biopolymer transport system component